MIRTCVRVFYPKICSRWWWAVRQKEEDVLVLGSWTFISGYVENVQKNIVFMSLSKDNFAFWENQFQKEQNQNQKKHTATKYKNKKHLGNGTFSPPLQHNKSKNRIYCCVHYWE